MRQRILYVLIPTDQRRTSIDRSTDWVTWQNDSRTWKKQRKTTKNETVSSCHSHVPCQFIGSIWREEMILPTRQGIHHVQLWIVRDRRRRWLVPRRHCHFGSTRSRGFVRVVACHQKISSFWCFKEGGKWIVRMSQNTQAASRLSLSLNSSLVYLQLQFYCWLSTTGSRRPEWLVVRPVFRFWFFFLFFGEIIPFSPLNGSNVRPRFSHVSVSVFATREWDSKKKKKKKSKNEWHNLH